MNRKPSSARNAPPPGKAWTWLTSDMLKSDAWRSLTVNDRRLLDFLMVELMSKAGQQNGNLKAPYRQLKTIGIGMRLINETIDHLGGIGLIDVHRKGLRVATTYTLTWLPTEDGKPASNRWRSHRDPALEPWPTAKRTTTSPKHGEPIVKLDALAANNPTAGAKVVELRKAGA